MAPFEGDIPILVSPSFVILYLFWTFYQSSLNGSKVWILAAPFKGTPILESPIFRFNLILTRILLLYVMIVKLRQNFTKMREFSWIRDQKKIMLKIFIVYEIWLCSQMGTLAVFSTNFWNQFKVLFISMQNNQNNQLHGTFPITWQRLICANTCCILLKMKFNWNYLEGGGGGGGAK